MRVKVAPREDLFRKPILKCNQTELVLKYIIENGCITAFQAYQDLGVTQLATRIKELKDLGYQFKTEDIRTKNRYGKPTHYYKYYLVKEG